MQTNVKEVAAQAPLKRKSRCCRWPLFRVISFFEKNYYFDSHSSTQFLKYFEGEGRIKMLSTKNINSSREHFGGTLIFLFRVSGLSGRDFICTSKVKWFFWHLLKDLIMERQNMYPSVTFANKIVSIFENDGFKRHCGLGLLIFHFSKIRP